MVGSTIRKRARQSLFVSRLMLPMLLLGVANTTPSVVGGTRTEPREATGGNFAYLVGCGGDYLRIDADQYKVVSRGRVWDDPSTQSIHPDSFARFDGCLVDSLRSDPQRGVVYLVVKEHGFDDPQGNNEYWIAALRLPNFELVSKAGPFDFYPWLLLDAQADNLLVWHIDTIDHYSVPELKKGRSVKHPSGRVFASRAYWTKEGELVDGDRIFDESLTLKRRIEGRPLLTPQLRQELARLERLGVRGKKYLDVTFAESAANRMLFLVGWDMRTNPLHTGSGLLVYDLESESTLSPIITPYRAAAGGFGIGTPTVHLTPDGSLAVLEVYEWRAPEPEGTPTVLAGPPEESRFKTGEIAIYEMASGRLIRTVQLNPPPGFSGRVLGFSPDGESVYYGSSDRIHAVDLTGTKAIEVGTIEEKFFSTSLFFSDR